MPPRARLPTQRSSRPRPLLLKSLLFLQAVLSSGETSANASSIRQTHLFVCITLGRVHFP